MDVPRLAKLLQQADEAPAWPEMLAPPGLRGMLAGAILTRLLDELHDRHVEAAPAGGGVRLSGIAETAIGQLCACLARHGMCEASFNSGGKYTVVLSESGCALLHEASRMALACRPLLHELRKALFDSVGDASSPSADGAPKARPCHCLHVPT